MKAKRMLAIVAIAFAILCGFAFASAKAQTNANFVKPDATKRLVLSEGGTQKIYCDSSQVGAYSVSAKSYNGGPGYSRIFCPPVYVNVYHSKDRKAWRWIDFVAVETFNTGIERGNEQKFFFSRKIDGFYCIELSHAFDSIPGSRAGRVSAVLKTFSWKSLVQDIDSATKIENPDGFSEEKMKLQDLGADYIDQAKKLSVILRIAAESISTNPARISYAKYLPSPYDEPNLDLIRYKNLFYVKALAGSVDSYAESLQREKAFRVYSQDLAKAADELKKMTDNWPLEKIRQLPRERLTAPPEKIFKEAAEAMRKVAVCVETASEVMKSNLVLAEGGQVRRFAPLLARELAVPVIEQSGPNCGKTAYLMLVKYFYPEIDIDDAWLNTDNEARPWLGFFEKKYVSQKREDWLDFFKEQIQNGYPLYISVSKAYLISSNTGGKRHALVVTGFASDGSLIFTTWGGRWVFSKEKFREVWCDPEKGKAVCPNFLGEVLQPLNKPVDNQTSSVSTAKDDTLALEEK